MKPPLTIIAVDSHYLFLQGVKNYFSGLPFVFDVYTCLDYEQFKVTLTDHLPDIIFLDLNMPSADPFWLCAELKIVEPQIIIAILTQYNEPHLIQKAKKAGADAFFLKNSDPKIIRVYLENVREGNINGFFAHVPDSPKPASTVIKDGVQLNELLTIREREILNMMLDRVAHSEIEKLLRITNSTFKMHRRNIFNKLHFKSAMDLGVFAAKNGMRRPG